MPEPTAVPPVPPGVDLRAHHLLALPADVALDEVAVLAESRFPAARWEVPPRVAVARLPQGRGAPATSSAGVLRLSRLSTLTGPYAAGPGVAVGLGLPATTAGIVVVTCPRERGDPPYPGGDRDGLKRAFRDAMPVREEERVLQWLVDAARRLGGAVRTSEHGVVLQPEPAGAVDLTVYTDRWVEPAWLADLVRRVTPRVRVDEPPDGRVAPSAVPSAESEALRQAVLAAYGVADERERARLHAEADAFDAAMLTAGTTHGYGLVIGLGVDGGVGVEVGEVVPEGLPPVLRGLPWTADGAVGYRVRWLPDRLEDLEAERPPLPVRVARGRAAPVIRAVARLVQENLGGEVADDAGFLVAPEDL